MPSTSTLTEETRRWQKAVSTDAGGTIAINVKAAADSGVNDAAADGTTFIKVGGIASQTGTRVAENDDVMLRLNRFGGTRPERMNVVVGTITTSTATTTRDIGSLTAIGNYTEAIVVVEQTAAGGDTNSSTVFLESRFDGTNWLGIAASTISATATSQIIMLTKHVATNGIQILMSALPGPGTVRNVGFADDIRARATITGDTASVSIRVSINLIG